MIKVFFQSKYALIYIILIAVVMRLVIINQSFWLDEAIGAIAVKDYSYSGILNEFIKNDNHTPLYYLFLKFWSNIFGYSELALRSLSVLFGTATVYLTYKIAKIINIDKMSRFPLIAAIFIATSQFHIYYTQEARMYSMAAFFATLAVYSFINTFNNKSISYWILFSFSILVTVFTDYVPMFLIPALFIYAFINVKNISWWLLFICSFIPLILLGIWWFPTFLIQSQNGQWLLKTLPEWEKLAGGATIKQVLLVWMKFVFGRISYPNKLYYYVLVSLASIPFIFAFTKLFFTKKTKKITLVLIWLIIPLIGGFIISFWIPAFIYFRFLYCLPAFYLLVAWSIDTFTIVPIKKTIIMLIIGVNMFGWLTYVIDERQQREQWRQAVEFIEGNANNNDVAIFEFPKPFAPYIWYQKGLVDALGVTDSIAVNEVETKNITKVAVSGKSGIYYFEYLHDLSDPKNVVVKTLSEVGFEKKDVYNFIGVGQIFYYAKI